MSEGAGKGTTARYLADVLADFAELGQYATPEVRQALGDLIAEVRCCGPEFLFWHDLPGAVLLSGKPPGYFRSRFKGWQARGLARSSRRGHHEFLECVIPKQEAIADLVRDAQETADADARDRRAAAA
jgi:hypothetical protein